ncbi:MAG TPA: VOC family protein, partial [Polyangiaceae bacterium]|nr:VOC family protein [Polyangiaceae bacterium]
MKEAIHVHDHVHDSDSKPAAARTFYEGALGLKVEYEDDFAIACDAHGTSLRIQKVEALRPQPVTALGWTVPDIAAAVDGLAKNGVRFERYGGMDQDKRGIWNAPGGAKVAWFKDPDGNTLSLTERRATRITSNRG